MPLDVTRKVIFSPSDLLNLPAMRKVFNTVYATSRLFTDYSYQEMRTTRTLAVGMREHVEGEVLEVDELQLALAHLRVSELA